MQGYLCGVARLAERKAAFTVLERLHWVAIAKDG